MQDAAQVLAVRLMADNDYALVFERGALHTQGCNPKR